MNISLPYVFVVEQVFMMIVLLVMVVVDVCPAHTS